MKVEVKLIPSGVDEDGEDRFLELDEAIISTLRPLLGTAVRKKVDEVKDTIIQGIVTEHVSALSREAFSEAFQATDHWGRKKGEPKSLPQIVAEVAVDYLNQKVDSQDRPSYNGKPRCQAMMLSAVNDALTGEIDKQLKTLREEFAAKIANKISNIKVT